MKIIHLFIFPFTKNLPRKCLKSYSALSDIDKAGSTWKYKYYLLFVKYGILHYHKTIAFDMILFNKHIGKPGKIYVFGSWLHLALNAI